MSILDLDANVTLARLRRLMDGPSVQFLGDLTVEEIIDIALAGSQVLKVLEERIPLLAPIIAELVPEES